MEADSEPVSDNRADRSPGTDEEPGSVPFDRMVWPRPAPEGERIRRELAAIIYDLLDWAKHHSDTPETQPRSDEDGAADDNLS